MTIQYLWPLWVGIIVWISFLVGRRSTQAKFADFLFITSVAIVMDLMVVGAGLTSFYVGWQVAGACLVVHW